MSKKPLISIITVNLNNLEGLKRTANSVLSQTWTDFEFIIIDGGSDDGSKEYIKEIGNSLTNWVSEPDDGIYAAMNKGIDRSQGDYIIFLNSGDYFVNEKILLKFSEMKPVEDLVYGDILIEENNKFRIKTMPKLSNYISALTNTINHQAIFFSERLFRNENRYKCEFNLIADWVFINDAFLREKISVRHLEQAVICFDQNGVSRNKLLRWQEREIYLKSRFGKEFLDLLQEHYKLQLEYDREVYRFANFKQRTLIKNANYIHKLYLKLHQLF